MPREFASRSSKAKGAAASIALDHIPEPNSSMNDCVARVTEKDARDVAEEARETEWQNPSFSKNLFLGRIRMDLLEGVDPTAPHASETEAFLWQMEEVLKDVDGEIIERDGKIPNAAIEALAGIGAFGIKIPKQYGGRGLTQRAYNDAVSMAGMRSAALGALLSAHQSIGVPQPLKLFGTPEQKEKYLPRLAAGAISAFALTEPDVGSDPARLATTADRHPDGGWVLNGTKLWCTNGPVADLLVVMARTPAAAEGGKRPITAFIVETNTPGVTVAHRCDFMGLRGIENGVLEFRDVRVPDENILWGEGKGLKLALITLNTGRLTVPAMCAAAGEWCTKVVRDWANEREQWGAPIGRHDAVAQMIADIASTSFAMRAVADLAAELADAGTHDIRIEAALAKMWNSEAAWRVADKTVQIRGGRGYETAASLMSRGEAPVPTERLLRDLRINLIFEGTSEIMRLFIAREAVDPHLRAAGDLLDPHAPLAKRALGLLNAGLHFGKWYPTLLFPVGSDLGSPRNPLHHHLRFAETASRRIGRTLAHAMVRYGPGLEHRQAVLGRVVSAGAELFAMIATIHRAELLQNSPGHARNAARLADVFCRNAAMRITQHLDSAFDPNDTINYSLAQEIMTGDITLER